MLYINRTDAVHPLVAKIMAVNVRPVAEVEEDSTARQLGTSEQVSKADRNY